MMKKRLLLLLSILSMGMYLNNLNSLHAQKISGTFTEWEDCYPNGKNKVGMQPVGWTASNVYQILVGKEFVFQDTDRTEDPKGHSAKMKSDFVGLGTLGSNAPAFLTLGEMWVYANILEVTKSDGGVLGGIEFPHRPDSLTLYYKRTVGEENPDEPARIIIAFWKGAFKSQIPTGTDTFKDVEDDLKHVFGRDPENLKEESDGVLIAKAEYELDKTKITSEWTRLSIPIEYLTDDTPEKMNIVLSANSFWTRTGIGKDNTLCVDDVNLVYISKLRSIMLDGEKIADYDEDVFEYQFPYDNKDKVLTYTAYQDADVVVTEDSGEGFVKKNIEVTSNTAAGEKKYTYSILFKGVKTEITTPATEPSFVYGDEINDLGFTSNSTTPFTYISSNEKVIRFNEETGKLQIVGVGNVEITACQAGNDTHSSATSQQPLKVTVTPAKLLISLKEGGWVERGVNVYPSYMTSGNCWYEFTYDGLKYDDTPEIALTKTISISGNAPGKTSPEKVGDKRNVTLSGAVAVPNYEIEYATGLTLEVTKTTLQINVAYQGTKFTDSKKEIGTAVGLDNYSDLFSFDLYGWKYADTNEELLAELGDNFPIIACDINSQTQLGEKCPVTLSFPISELTNYKLKSYLPEGAVLVVKKKPIITVEEVTDKKYGDPKFTLNATFKIDEGESAAKLSYSSSNTAIASVNTSGEVTIKKAGDAKIRISSAETDIYLIGEIYVEFKVNKVPLTAITTDATREYGEENPEFAPFEYEGFINGETAAKAITKVPIPATEAVKNSPAGEYSIIALNGEADNYEFISNAKLTIKKAPLAVTTMDATRKYGEENPEFTLGYEGFKNEETVDVLTKVPTTSTDAIKNSPVGNDYEIKAEGGQADNYEFTYKNDGKLTITKAALIVKAKDAERFAGEANPTFEFEYDGFITGEDENTTGIFTTAPTATCEANESSDPGKYPIIVTAGEAINYEMTVQDGTGTLTVKLTVGVGIEEADQVEIFGRNGKLYIDNNVKNHSIYVYDAQANLVGVYEGEMIEISELTVNNMYIVKIGNASTKIIIR